MEYSHRILLWTLLSLQLIIINLAARNQCTKFGHSCLGGFGKRQGGDDVDVNKLGQAIGAANAPEDIFISNTDYYDSNGDMVNPGVYFKDRKMSDQLANLRYKFNYGRLSDSISRKRSPRYGYRF